MTYCVAIKTDSGLVFASDSLTNAGIDNVSTYSKMHSFVQPGERTFVLLAAGNLATTQAVVKRLRDDCRLNNPVCLNTVYSISDAVDYLGTLSTDVQRIQAARDANTNFDATFIFGGQIAGQLPEIFMVYPQGNHIHESAAHPFLQIGETKYGKPILDRVIRPDTPLEQAARCTLRAGVDSTIRSNLTVGPLVELLIYNADALNGGRRLQFSEDHPYYRALASAWNEGLRQALNNLPPFEWESQPQPLQVVAASGSGQIRGEW